MVDGKLLKSKFYNSTVLWGLFFHVFYGLCEQVIWFTMDVFVYIF